MGTCKLLPCQVKDKGDGSTPECVNGLCLCHNGYHGDGSGICQRGWWPPTLMMLQSANQTWRPAFRVGSQSSEALNEIKATHKGVVHLWVAWIMASVVGGFAIGIIVTYSYS